MSPAGSFTQPVIHVVQLVILNIQAVASTNPAMSKEDAFSGGSFNNAPAAIVIVSSPDIDQQPFQELRHSLDSKCNGFVVSKAPDEGSKEFQGDFGHLEADLDKCLHSNTRALLISPAYPDFIRQIMHLGTVFF